MDEDYDSRSPTRVKAARRFFLGGSLIPSSVLSRGIAEVISNPEGGNSPALLALIPPDISPSTLAAGVSGGRGSRGGKGLFIGTVGVTMGEITVGNDVVVSEGVDMGVATAELVRGSE